MAGEGCFDLAEFHAKTPHLDLMIDSTQIFEFSMGSKSGKISSLIDPRILFERMINKSLVRQFRTIAVPRRLLTRALRAAKRKADA